MQFSSWSEFWLMGGYAIYVWLSFGATFAAMAVITLQSFFEHKALVKRVRSEQHRKARIQASRLRSQQQFVPPDEQAE